MADQESGIEPAGALTPPNVLLPSHGWSSQGVHDRDDGTHLVNIVRASGQISIKAIALSNIVSSRNPIDFIGFKSGSKETVRMYSPSSGQRRVRTRRKPMSKQAS